MGLSLDYLIGSLVTSAYLLASPSRRLMNHPKASRMLPSMRSKRIPVHIQGSMWQRLRPTVTILVRLTAFLFSSSRYLPARRLRRMQIFIRGTLLKDNIEQVYSSEYLFRYHWIPYLESRRKGQHRHLHQGLDIKSACTSKFFRPFPVVGTRHHLAFSGVKS